MRQAEQAQSMDHIPSLSEISALNDSASSSFTSSGIAVPFLMAIECAWR